MSRQLQVEVMDRFARIESFFKSTRHMSGDASATARGLVFVEVYGIYEHAFCGTMQLAVDSISEHGFRYADLPPGLLSLFLDDEFKAAKQSGWKKSWLKRLQLLETAFSYEPAVTANTVMPIDGSHFRHTQLLLMFRTLGISRCPTRRRSHLYRIDEVVENRNAVAHGRSTAKDVGKRYSRTEVRRILRQMRSVCLTMIDLVDAHCCDAGRFSR